MSKAGVFRAISSSLNGVRRFSTAQLSTGKMLEEICPWYKVPAHFNDQKFSSFNSFRFSLASKLDPLIHGDGFHKGVENIEEGLAGRARIIANYHQAILEAEEKFILGKVVLGKMVLDGKVAITCIETENKKAKGCAVIASLNGEVVGRMFMADALDAKHLTVFSTYNQKILDRNSVNALDVAQQMLQAYFTNRKLSKEEFENLMASRVRKSCLENCDSMIVKIAQKQGLLPPDNGGEHPLSSMIKYCARDEDDVMYEYHIGDAQAAAIEMNFPMKSLALLAGVERYALLQEELPQAKITLADDALRQLVDKSLVQNL